MKLDFDCPRCGGRAVATPGPGPEQVWGWVPSAIAALREANLSQLKDMQSILQDSQAGKLTAEAATEQAAAISPDMAALIAALQRRPQWTAPVIVGTLLATLAVVLAWMSLNQTNTLIDADHAALEHKICSATEQIVPRSSVDSPVVRSQSPARRDQPPVRKAKTSPTRKKRKPPKTYGRDKKRRR